MNKQFAIAALVSAINAADCIDAYTALADAEVKATAAALAAAKAVVVAQKEVDVKAKAATAAEKLKWDPINTLIKDFKTKLDESKAAFKVVNDAYNNASDGSGAETIDLGDTKALGLWNDANVKMTFSAKKTDLATLEKAKVTAEKATAACEGEIVTLKGSKTKYDDEKARRVAS